jgi:hypothetical protein
MHAAVLRRKAPINYNTNCVYSVFRLINTYSSSRKLTADSEHNSFSKYKPGLHTSRHMNYTTAWPQYHAADSRSENILQNFCCADSLLAASLCIDGNKQNETISKMIAVAPTYKVWWAVCRGINGWMDE